jgi:hypothetical protein
MAKYWYRVTSFFYFSSVALVAEIVATPISGLTMTKDPWVPFLASSGMELLAVIVALLFAPETHHFVNNLSFAMPSPSTDTSEPIPTKKPSFVRLWADKLWGNLKKTRELTHFVWKNLNITLVLLVFLAATLSRQAMALLLQYVTKRYRWTYSKVSFPSKVNLSTSSNILI